MRLKHVVKKMISDTIFFLQKKDLIRFSEHPGFRILLYHSVGRADSTDHLGLRVSCQNFMKQMEFLNDEGYRVYNLEELLDAVKEKRPIQPKSLAITFDDGYKDVLLNAFPVLRRFNFPAAIFVALDYIDGRMNNSEKYYWEKWEYLSRDDIKDLARMNITIGSHSLSHRPLAGLTSETIEREAVDSKKRLEEIIGRPVDLFSYPHGSVDRKSKDALGQAGYIAAYSSRVGKNNHEADLFEFNRTEISGKDDLFEFKKKVKGCYDWVAYFKKGRGR